MNNNKQMDELEESLIVAKRFISLMDNPQEWSYHDLSEDAILDWFGRSVFGRDSIISFIRSHLPRTHHMIENIAVISPITHRSLKRFESPVTQPQYFSKVLVDECGQGDCKGKSTPENIIRPNLEELVKAPCKRQYAGHNFDTHQWQFLEIKGKMELEHTLYDGTSYVMEEKIEKIVLGYTDRIHLVVYEGRNLCRKKLSSLLNVDE